MFWGFIESKIYVIVEKLYTICIFTENTLGLLNRISGIFTRRRINIESLSVSATERKGVSRFTIVIKSDEREQVEKIVRQIRKNIEVLAVFGYEDTDMTYKELSFFKVESSSHIKAMNILDSYHRTNELVDYTRGLNIKKTEM